MPKAEKCKKVHLIPVRFDTAITLDTAKGALRRAIMLAVAQKLANQAAWEASPHLALNPTVLPLPQAPKPVPAKKARKAKKRSR